MVALIKTYKEKMHEVDAGTNGPQAPTKFLKQNTKQNCFGSKFEILSPAIAGTLQGWYLPTNKSVDIKLIYY